MQTEKVFIVDENDKIIGLKERDLLEKGDIYRASCLWVENSKGEVLLAKRAFGKSNSPGKWGPAAAGTLEEGETYDSNIYQEAEEEIGLVGKVFKKVGKFRYEGKHNFFGQWYYLLIDEELDFFKIQEEEVAEIKWIDKDELGEEIKNNPEKFIDTMRTNFDLFKN